MRKHHRRFSASLGAPGPHDFSVRGGLRSSRAASASIAARNSAYRDDAYAPLHEAGCIREDTIGHEGKAEYFSRHVWTDGIALRRREKFDFWRRDFECVLVAGVTRWKQKRTHS